MPPTAAHDRRFAELTALDDVTAVDVVDLGLGSLSFTARNDAGRVVKAIAVDQAGQDLDAPVVLDRLVAVRAQAQRDELAATRHLRAHVAAQVAAGQDVNLAELARQAGIARSTLYLWRDDAQAAA